MAIRRHGDRRHANPSPVLAIGNQSNITAFFEARATNVSSARMFPDQDLVSYPSDALNLQTFQFLINESYEKLIRIS
jgi:hypothetical protein